MNNQHKYIKGYRDLTEEEIRLINEVKELAEEVNYCITSLENTSFVDKRWAAIAKTDLQKGFMFLIRSITKPTTF